MLCLRLLLSAKCGACAFNMYYITNHTYSYSISNYIQHQLHDLIACCKQKAALYLQIMFVLYYIVVHCFINNLINHKQPLYIGPTLSYIHFLFSFAQHLQ